jgi:excisionase family DNA binding protein
VRPNALTPEPTDDEITVAAAAERARVSRSHIGNLAKDGRITARRIGSRVFINTASLREYLRRTRWTTT